MHRGTPAAELSALLTVEEAAGLLRIGRTKAYAMAREWRDSGGRSGLPVVDFGSVLRVPLCGLEAMVGGPLFDVPVPADEPVPVAGAEPEPVTAPEAVIAHDPHSRSRSKPRRRSRPSNQPTLPFAS